MGSGQPIKLAERRVFSDLFKPLYNEGMSLDGARRRISRRPAAAPRRESCRGWRRRSTPPNRCG